MLFRSPAADATRIRQALDRRIDSSLDLLRDDIVETTSRLEELGRRVTEVRRATSRASERASTRSSRVSSDLDELSADLESIEGRVETLEQSEDQAAAEPQVEAGAGGVAVP